MYVRLCCIFKRKCYWGFNFSCYYFQETRNIGTEEYTENNDNIHSIVCICPGKQRNQWWKLKSGYHLLFMAVNIAGVFLKPCVINRWLGKTYSFIFEKKNSVSKGTKSLNKIRGRGTWQLNQKVRWNTFTVE